MSIANTYQPQSCTITTPGTPTVADNGATSTGGGTVSTTYRGNLGQRTYYRDGKIVVGFGPIHVPAGVTIPANGTVTAGGTTYGILRAYPLRGMGGVVIEQTIELGPLP